MTVTILPEPGDPRDWVYGPEFARRHAEMLRASGIHPSVAAERGYRTVDDPAELAALGFADYQIGPGLLVPIHVVGSDEIRYQLRRDVPRLRRRRGREKPVKYETPEGQRFVLDAPKRIQLALRDPAVELFITEGPKKVDALVTAGCVAIGVLGVWGFTGTNEHDGKTILSDWRHIALNGRPVFVVYDSDFVTKPDVCRALRALKSFLRHRGARVRIVPLPSEVTS